MTRRDFGREAVVEAIRQRAGNDHAAVVSIDTLALDTGLCERAVRDAIRRAITAHELALEKRGHLRVNRYRLVNGARSATAALLRALPENRADSRQEAPTPAVTAGSPATTGSDCRLPGSHCPAVTAASKSTTCSREVLGEALALWEAPTAAPSPPPIANKRPPRAPAQARARRRDDLFDAIAAAWLGADVPIGRSAAGVIGKAVTEVREQGGVAEEVPARWEECLRRYDEPGPLALAKHWHTLGRQQRVAERGRTSTRGRVAADRDRILSLERRA